ncbi:hypothetical protein Vretimale_10772 [Volvox reticuliferus]|uniref:PhoD-like phosphatase domain-containing protein n=1 Tax=Volvox reticuliferus TaxID=1737510 RepID=A0A8J4GG06_9CHLO|nr:hypothetical protein Vretimale_10772 [Volvox reticuliferus]
MHLSALVVCSEEHGSKVSSGTPSVSWWVEPTSGSDGGDGRPHNPLAAVAAAVAGNGVGVGNAHGAGLGVQDGYDGTATGPAATAGATTAEATGYLLYSWRNWRFWRFQMHVMCSATPHWLRYQLNLVPEHTFTVALPARDQAWSWALYTCNGLDNPGNKDSTGGLQPLWSDIMSQHAQQPLHVLVGGGDQIYNDAVFDGPLLKGWDHTLKQSDTSNKASIPFTDEMRQEVEEFYFSHYCVHFSQPVYAQALASIPSVNIWDDHDIFDGWGSYPAYIQAAPVLKGVFAAAHLFYLLFQQHTRVDLLESDGFWSGTSALHRFGSSVAVVLPDTRSFRTISQVCPPTFYAELHRRLMALPETVRHVALVLTVPILWPMPDLPSAIQTFSNDITRDKLLNELMGITGLMRKLPMRFGEIEILDDLKDHWDSKEHKKERDALLKMLIHLSAERAFRFTLLSGDVHCAGYGMIHGRGDESESDVEDMPVPTEKQRAADPRFIPQIVSSAIVNVPPPSYVLLMNGRAGAHPMSVLGDCVWRMMSLTRHFHLGSKSPDDLLLGERNWCRVAQRDAEDGHSGKLLFSLRHGWSSHNLTDAAACKCVSV